MLAAPKLALKGTKTPYCSPAQNRKKAKHKVLKEKTHFINPKQNWSWGVIISKCPTWWEILLENNYNQNVEHFSHKAIISSWETFLSLCAVVSKINGKPYPNSHIFALCMIFCFQHECIMKQKCNNFEI